MARTFYNIRKKNRLAMQKMKLPHVVCNLELGSCFFVAVSFILGMTKFRHLLKKGLEMLQRDHPSITSAKRLGGFRKWPFLLPFSTVSTI